MAGQTFTTMDGLRGVAAIVVVLLHLPYTALKPANGYLAVDLFFALSGFVIAYAYESRLSGLKTAAPFMVARLIRLYPAYLIGLAIGVAAYLVRSTVDGPLWPAGLAATTGFNGLFLPVPPMFGTNPDQPFPLVFPAWSLFWELVVNAAFALLLPLLSTRVIAVLLPILAAVLMLVVFRVGDLDIGVGWADFGLGSIRVSFSFAAGVMLYRLWKSGRLQRRLPVWLSLALLVGILCVPVGETVRPWFDAAVAIVVFPVLLATSTGTAGNRLMSWLGRLSYPLYVVHAPLIALATAVALATGYDVQRWGGGGAAALIIMSIAVASVVGWIDPALRRSLSDLSLRFGLLTPMSRVTSPAADRPL